VSLTERAKRSIKSGKSRQENHGAKALETFLGGLNLSMGAFSLAFYMPKKPWLYRAKKSMIVSNINP